MNDFKREATVVVGLLTLASIVIPMLPIAIMAYLGVHKGFMALVSIIAGLVVALNLLTLISVRAADDR